MSTLDDGSVVAVTPPLRRTCGTMQVHFQLLEAHPDFRLRQVELEHRATDAMRITLVTRPDKYRVNVVVHVVYNDPGENISDDQVKSQIVVLNQDYSATNADRDKTPNPWSGLISNPQVEFFLASVDPSGAATNGITRTKTDRVSFVADNDSIKSASSGGVSPWPSDKYLNLWVCGTLLDIRGSSILGYAQFPGGPVDTDGVVIWNRAFGTFGSALAPFNLGRTATHEIGHYFNLRHIWGDAPNCTGDDLVADTPPAETSNFQKPVFPHISCGNGPNGDMFMNYMDYVDDDSMYMFTAGQVSRIRATLDGPRASLVSAEAP